MTLRLEAPVFPSMEQSFEAIWKYKFAGKPGFTDQDKRLAAAFFQAGHDIAHERLACRTDSTYLELIGGAPLMPHERPPGA